MYKVGTYGIASRSTTATIILVPLGLFIALNTDEDDSAGASSGAIS